jgi:hypothetical protein
MSQKWCIWKSEEVRVGMEMHFKQITPMSIELLLARLNYRLCFFTLVSNRIMAQV